MSSIKPEQIRGLTEFLKHDDSLSPNVVGGRALEATRLLREGGKLTPFELGARLKGVTLRELEDLLNVLEKLGLIERTRDRDEEVISLSERGMQITAPMNIP